MSYLLYLNKYVLLKLNMSYLLIKTDKFKGTPIYQ
jgi:hypothetical protein